MFYFHLFLINIFNNTELTKSSFGKRLLKELFSSGLENDCGKSSEYIYDQGIIWSTEVVPVIFSPVKK